MRSVFVLFLIVSSSAAFASEDVRIGGDLRGQAIRRACVALKQLGEGANTLGSLKAQIGSVDPLRQEMEKVISADSANQKLKKSIMNEIASLTGVEAGTCSLIELNGGGDCQGRIDPGSRNRINVAIDKYNRVHGEVTPKLDRWSSASTTIEKLLKLLSQTCTAGLGGLEVAVGDCWDAMALLQAQNPDHKIRGLMSRSVDFDEETAFKSCLRARISVLKGFLKNSVVSGTETWLNAHGYSPVGRMVGTIGSLYKSIDALASLHHVGCENDLDMPAVLDALSMSCFPAK